MSWRPVLQAVLRLGIVLSVAVSGMTFAAADAEARRGGKVRTVKERATDTDASSRRKSDDEPGVQGADGSSGTHIPRVRSREATRGSPESTADVDGGTAARPPRTHVMWVRPSQDIDVPGCPTGMICTVCLAGCRSDDVGAIVDTQPKTPAPSPRR